MTFPDQNWKREMDINIVADTDEAFKQALLRIIHDIDCNALAELAYSPVYQGDTDNVIAEINYEVSDVRPSQFPVAAGE